MEPLQRQWGKTEIVGGRHAFRIKMMVRMVAASVPQGAAILDAGCGDGSLSLALLEMGYAMTAVDASAPGIERLGRKIADARANGPGSISSLRASLETLPFPPASFDAVVSGEVLEHLDDDRAGAAELFRVLRPGGRCFISVPANPDLWSIEDEWAGHKRRYRSTDLAEIFEEASFKVLEIHHWGWPVTWLYDRLFYRAWVAGQLKKGISDPDTSKMLGAHPLVVRAMYYAFSIDRIFQGLPFGIGLMGLFRKPD